MAKKKAARRRPLKALKNMVVGAAKSVFGTKKKAAKKKTKKKTARKKR